MNRSSHRSVRTRQTLTAGIVLALATVALLVAVSTAGAVATTDGETAAVGLQTDTQPADAVNVSIIDIQKNDSGNASPYAGETVTTNGTVTAVGSDGFYIQNGSGKYRGVFVRTDNASEYAEGDVVSVTAPVEENFDFTRLNGTASGTSIETTGTASVPSPVMVDTGNVSAEAYESVQVKLTNLTVTATPGQFGEWKVDDGSGEARIDDVTLGDDTTPESVNATIDSITGPMFYSFGNFKLQPQSVTNLTEPPSDDPDIPDNATNMTVLMYNDIQTAASNPSAMGHLVGVINERRQAHDNPTVVVGGGDQIGPNSLGPFTRWETPVDVLNTLDPAAEVVGNHDLDYGIDSVSNFSAESEFPWLLANLIKEDSSNMPGTKNYTIVERGNLSVGVVGLVDDEIFSKTAIDFAGQGYKLADFSKVGGEIATDLKENKSVDVVIAAAHIGVPESKELAQKTENIDVIVTGDDEVAFEPKVVAGTAIVEAEGRAAYVGEVNLSVGNDSVVMRSDSRLIGVESLDDTSGLPTNETAKTQVQTPRDQYLTQVAGKTTVELDSRFTNYDEETRWGNFITDAFRNRTDSEVALTNAGGIRGNFIIPAGNVTYDDIYTSLPFGNYLVEKKMPGDELRELLASQVESLDAQFGSAASLQVSGVTYEYIDRPNADPVIGNVFVNGEPLKPNREYTVTVNSYMASWDRLANLTTIETDPTQYGTVVAEYLEDQSPITPSDADRIRRVTRSTTSSEEVASTDGTYNLTFSTPFAQSIANDTFIVENETNAVIEAKHVSLDNGTLTAVFNASTLKSMALASEDVTLYGKYNDTEYEHPALEYAVLKTNVPIKLPVQLAGYTPQDLDNDGAFEDLNGDGKLTQADYMLLYKFYRSPTVQSHPQMFDYNGDLQVTIEDVTALRQEIAG